MGLLVSRVKNFKPKTIHDLEDLKSVGTIGLIKAAKTWDSTQSKFSTYASTCIDNVIRTYLKANKKHKKSLTNREDLLDTILEKEKINLTKDVELLSDQILKDKLAGFTIKEISDIYNISVYQTVKLYNQAKDSIKNDYSS